MEKRKRKKCGRAAGTSFNIYRDKTQNTNRGLANQVIRVHASLYRVVYSMMRQAFMTRLTIEMVSKGDIYFLSIQK